MTNVYTANMWKGDPCDWICMRCVCMCVCACVCACVYVMKECDEISERVG